MKQLRTQSTEQLQFVNAGFVHSLFVPINSRTLSTFVGKNIGMHTVLMFYPLLQEINLSKNFSSEMEFRKIDPWPSSRCTSSMNATLFV
jgi:hypothetical protein